MLQVLTSQIVLKKTSNNNNTGMHGWIDRHKKCLSRQNMGTCQYSKQNKLGVRMVKDKT